MIPFKFIIIAIVFFGLGILLNAFSIRYVINKAIRKFIKPNLQAKGVTFVDYKWLGFFNHGDFKNDKFILIPSMKAGKPVISTYIDIYYLETSVKKKRTVRIDTFFVFIRRVLYSSEVK